VGYSDQLFEVRRVPLTQGEPQSTHVDALEYGRQAAAMVEISVAGDHQIQPLDSECGEGRQYVSLAPVPAPWECCARVHQQGSLDSLNQEGIALPYIQRHESRGFRIEALGRSNHEPQGDNHRAQYAPTRGLRAGHRQSHSRDNEYRRRGARGCGGGRQQLRELRDRIQ